MPWLWILNSKSWDLDSRLGGYWICVINGIFFKGSLNFKWRFERILKIDLTLSLILWFNLRLGAYSICSARTSHTIYKNSGLEHLIASMQPRKYSEDYLKHSTDSKMTRCKPEAVEALEDAFWSTRRLQNSTTKSSGDCQTRGSGTTYRHRIF